ncbi:sigma-70 family RNA polymerase sigma factor [Staphylococcus ureilyticus]|nr:sigma-70 family RNA polymerase sigma factor [Staphylococcus ureilyticus]UXS60531.1 sigma-70 family RNA polymerase sigma factor [Staphylococcus ureilyticus]
MMYDKGTVKEFILNYHKTIDNNDTSFEDVIFFNELEAIVERVATEEEHNLFLLLSNGVKFEETGSIFGVQSQRIRQMFNSLLDKMK